MTTDLNILEAAAVRTQGYAAAAWRDIQMARGTKGFPVEGMKGLLSNYAASRAAEIDAVKAWQDALSA